MIEVTNPIQQKRKLRLRKPGKCVFSHVASKGCSDLNAVISWQQYLLTPSRGLPGPESPKPVSVTCSGQSCDKVGVLREGVYPVLSRWTSNATRDILGDRGRGSFKRKEEETNVTTEAEMWPQATEHLQLPETGRDRGLIVSWSPQRGHCPATTLISDFWPLEL